MKTPLQLANEWVEQYAFQVPYNSNGPIANEDYYDSVRLKHGMDGFLAGYESAQSQLSALQQENEKLRGNVIDFWDKMPNDLQSDIEEQAPGFYKAIESLRR